MHTPTGRAILHAITHLGRHLNLPVIAIGVDTPDQRRALWEAGCTSGQGAHLGGSPTLTRDTLVRTLRHSPCQVADAIHDGAVVIPLRTQQASS